MDELGWSRRGGCRGAQGTFASGQRGCGGRGRGGREVGGAPDSAGTQLTWGGELPAHTGRLDDLRMSRVEAHQSADLNLLDQNSEGDYKTHIIQ